MTTVQLSPVRRSRRAGGGVRVALVCMPFYDTHRPSIAVGLLAAVARRAGHTAETIHLNLELAARIGEDTYNWLCHHRGHMTGEWLFGSAAFGVDAVGPDEAFCDAFPRVDEQLRSIGRDRAYLAQLRREELPAYIDDCAASVDWGRFEVVGFTSTFQQNVASLALARRIKERSPRTLIVFGGANMEQQMGPEYVRGFDFIDYAVVGEGEAPLTHLLDAVAAGCAPDDFLGLAQRTDLARAVGQAAPVTDMDSLPMPVYDEYFDRMAKLDLHGAGTPIMSVETSRGCWWGQKHHCTFCGLNTLGMQFRSKSPERVLSELAHLAEKHRATSFMAVDNILDMRYVDSLFGAIADDRLDYHFFYEVKANLSPAQLRRLRLGGVMWIQPGIESLSTHVLQLMRKGCSMLQNVRLLKWCQYYGIRVSWNLLWGFPGETADDYREELEVLKLITHLQPPSRCARIWLERFAPYFADESTFPITAIRPEASYAHAYPPALGLDLDRIAYFFEYEMGDTLPDETHEPTIEWVAEWQTRRASKRPDSLVYQRSRDMVIVYDSRGTTRPRRLVYEGAQARAFEHCTETMRSARGVAEHLADAGYAASPATASEILDGFCEEKLMLREDGRYLGLALPANLNW